MIPKVIHYCWLSNDPVPDDLKRYMLSWKKMLPEFAFKKWDFSVFDKSSSEWVSEAFDNKKYAFACDYIRLFAIYNYGGIYMDMDIEVLKSFDDLLSSHYFFGFENGKENSIEAGIFGAEKGNQFIKDCLDYYKERKFIKRDGSMDQRPLPQIMYEKLKEGDYKYSIMSCDRFTAKSFETGEEFPNNNTYTIHHFAGSWKSDDEKEILEATQKASKKYGVFIGRNVAQYAYQIKKSGLRGALQLTKEKVRRKLRIHADH